MKKPAFGSFRNEIRIPARNIKYHKAFPFSQGFAVRSIRIGIHIAQSAVMSDSAWRDKYEALSGICLAPPGSGGASAALERMLATLASRLAVGKALVLLCLDGVDKFVSCAGFGVDAVETADLARTMERAANALFTAPAPFAINREDRTAKPFSRTSHPDRSNLAFIGAPIRLQDRVAGVLLADRIFSDSHAVEEDAAFLEVLADYTAGLIGIENAARIETERMARVNAALRADLDKHSEAFAIIGQSRAAQDIRWQVEHVAPSRAPVLLKGERGTGKHRVARAIHHLSGRSQPPFVHADCAGGNSKAQDALLFGGPATGAANAIPGCLESAHGGTLYLQGIENLGREIQAKVLHFLRSREIMRPDNTRTEADVRIIASTTAGLDQAAASGEFNSDLFYRISVLPIEIPPLRHRQEDIPALANHFLGHIAERTGRRPTLDPGALNALAEQPWPANADDLKALLEKIAASVGDGQASRETIETLISAPLASHENNATPKASLKDMERDQVLAALKRNAWVQRRAAKELGLTQRQIGYKIEKYGLKSRVAMERARSRTGR